MRRRFYGKPLPPQRQVRAHLDLLQLTSEDIKMNVELTMQEISYLQRVLNFELHEAIKLQNHALAHGDEIDLTDARDAEQILAKLNL